MSPVPIPTPIPTPTPEEIKTLEASLVVLAGSLTTLILLKQQWFSKKYRKFRTFIKKIVKGGRR